MAFEHPYKESPQYDHDTPPRSRNRNDWGDVVDNVIEAGVGIGSTVLRSISGALKAVGDAFSGNEKPTFDKWRNRLELDIKNGKQDDSLAAWIVGGVMGGLFAIADVVMLILTFVPADVFGMTAGGHMVFPILFFSFLLPILGFGYMAFAGSKRYKYYKRLRNYLHAARDWVCDVPTLARLTLQNRKTVERDLQRAILDGHLPNTTLSDDGSTVYFDAALYKPTHHAQAKAEPQPAAEPAAPLTPAEQFKQEGIDFLNYLRTCRGKLGADADEELATMQKTCGAILGFVHNHPDQLGRVRRFQEYYLPTTRKLLDTALGLGNDGLQTSEQAQTIRRDITGILHTLNTAYGKLYDTLLQDVSLDVSTEIDTLEAMLRQDGLMHDFDSDFKATLGL